MSSSKPRVSVIIPAYHSHRTLGDCLEALRAQTFRDFEVIVVNSSPEQETARLITSKFPEVSFWQSPARLFPHAARNCGLQWARGEILVFTDPDCRASPDWLARLVEAQQAGHKVVGGSMALVSESALEWGVHLSKFYWLLPGLPPRICPVICTASASYDRSVWEQVGPFDGDLFIGDAVASWRAAGRGFPPWFEPRAVVEHRHTGDWPFYWRQFLARGRECGRARLELEQWPRWKAALRAASLPAALAAEEIRIGRAASRSGAAGWFVRSLPIHLMCKLAWLLGEAGVYWRFAALGRIRWAGIRR
jgi:glycosyltransferase involved in cell wall biosynthesis